MKLPCPSCQHVPRDAAVCVVCGALLCYSASCCRTDGRGECYRHSLQGEEELRCEGQGISLIFSVSLFPSRF